MKLAPALLLVFGSTLAPLVAPPAAHAQDLAYQTPPPAVAKFVTAPAMPFTSIGPDRATVLLFTPRVFPPVAEVAEPELRLAGLRINPRNRSQARRFQYDKIEILDARTKGAVPRSITGLPKDARLGDAMWSPDGTSFALTVTEAEAIRLWLVDVRTARASQLPASPLNGVFGRSCAWLADSRTLVCRTVPRGAKPPSAAATAPTGPIVQENDGKKRPARTNPDLLKTPADATLLEYHAASQIELVGTDGKTRAIGAPGLYASAQPAPDGKHLLVEAYHRPWSYQVAISRFPLRSEVWSLDGKALATIADLPLAEGIPVDFDAVRTGRREIAWRADAPATLCWAEAADGGDPKRAAPVRDTLDCLAAPFTGAPVRLASLSQRFSGVLWATGSLALVSEGWWKDRRTRTHVIAPGDAKAKPRVLWDRSSEDRYGDPGSPVMRRSPTGHIVMHVTSKGHLLLDGEGATPDGDRPFVDRLDPASGKTERLWRSEGAGHATLREVLDADGAELLLSRETPSTPPQLHAYTPATKQDRQITRFAHPVPELAKVSKQLIKWKRKDGVELSGMLYLPPGFRPKIDAPLPVLVWVYPQEFKSANAAAQVRTSPHYFIYPWWGGPMFALTQGYAVVDDPAFAIVGEGKAEPNDTYVEQLASDAASLIDHVVGMGVGDRARFAVGGHSYGAFTTANLLAHTDLFAAGIARSGAYNRTLTPFGFQSEERTYWEAAATYDRMSPFRYADKVDEPILLVHGMADDNSGTYPIQTERLFSALQGLGGKARYVQLPAESHGYRGRESALHVLWEQVRWLDAHVKQAKPRPAKK